MFDIFFISYQEPNADVNARFPDEIFFIDRKSLETRDVVEF